MSSAKQDKSIPAQREELLKIAKRKGYRIVREYVDPAVSGDDTEKRTGFLRLRADCENGPDFSVILVWNEDRFSRNDPLEYGYWLKPIRDSGVVVETPTGRVDWETLGGRLISLIGQEMRHDFLRTLSRNVTRGLLASAKQQGGGTGGTSPQGLRNDPERAAIVRRIFADYLKPDASLRSVADGLNRDGIRSPKGKPWSVTTIRFVLRNRKYAGAYVRFKYRAGKYNGVKNGEIVSRNRADRFEETEPIVVENHHDPIIDRRTFEAAQEKLARQKRHTAHRTGRQYAFSSLLRCGDCGLVMGGQISRRHRERSVYRCHTYTDGGKGACYSNSIGEDVLLDCVVRKIEEHYLSDQAIDRLLVKFRKRLAADRATVPADADRLRQRIKILDEAIDKGTDRVLSAPEALLTTIYAKIERLREDRAELQRQLQAAECHGNGSGGEDEQKVEAAVLALRDLRQAFRDADPADVRELLRRLVVKVEVEFVHRHNGNRIDNTPTGGKIHVRPERAVSILFTSLGS